MAFGTTFHRKVFYKGLFVPGDVLYEPDWSNIKLTPVGTGVLEIESRQKVDPSSRVILNPFDPNKSILWYHSDDELDRMLKDQGLSVNPFDYEDLGQRWYKADERTLARFMKLDKLGLLEPRTLGEYLEGLACPVVAEPTFIGPLNPFDQLKSPELYYVTNHLNHPGKPFNGKTTKFLAVSGLPGNIEELIYQSWK